MGGNALNVETERASPHHYLNVFVQVQHKILNEWPNAQLYLPRKHRYKQDHGDLDLLVRRDTVDLSRDWIKENVCREPFMPKNMTADQKQRDRKRPVWDQFGSYLKDLEKLGELPSKPDSRPTQEEAIEKAKEAFPFCDLHDQLSLDRERVLLRGKAKETFTGRDPMEEFGVEGKELGEMLSNFYETFNTSRHRYEWLVRNSREEALERFKFANSDEFEDVDLEKAQGDEKSITMGNRKRY